MSMKEFCFPIKGVSYTGGWIQGVTIQRLALKKQPVIELHLNI